jgi:hypothetical protein
VSFFHDLSLSKEPKATAGAAVHHLDCVEIPSAEYVKGEEVSLEKWMYNLAIQI